MGRPFPEQGDVTSRQVLTPSPRLHTPPLECATGDPQPSSLLLSTQPRGRALPGGGAERAPLKAPIRPEVGGGQHFPSGNPLSSFTSSHTLLLDDTCRTKGRLPTFCKSCTLFQIVGGGSRVHFSYLRGFD